MKKFFCTILITIFAAFTLAGCSPNSDTYTASYGENSCSAYYYSMHAEGALVVLEGRGNGRDGRVKALFDEVNGLLENLDNSLSATNEKSYVTAFNNAEAGSRVEIDVTAYEVLTIAKSVYELTEGYYNPAVYYGVQAYGFNGGTFPASAEELPADSEIAKYVELSSHFSELSLISENGNYFAVKPNYTVTVGGEQLSMKIDLGGVGKGYAADKVGTLMSEHGFEYGYFNFDSSSMSVKKHTANGGVYTLGFTSPRPRYYQDAYLQTTVADECISTSGDYERYFTIDGERYCHVFNPFTGKPVNSGVMTATLIGGSAAENDALTTAIMAMGREKAAEFINSKLSGRRAVFTYEEADGYKFYTNMPEGSYTILDERFTAGEDVT